jgi:hypothetical protein
MPFETEPLHIEAARMLRALADHIEEAGACKAYVAAIIVDEPDNAAHGVEFGGEAGAIEGVLDRIRAHLGDATFIHADTDFDALDAAAV